MCLKNNYPFLIYINLIDNFYEFIAQILSNKNQN